MNSAATAVASTLRMTTSLTSGGESIEHTADPVKNSGANRPRPALVAVTAFIRPSILQRQARGEAPETETGGAEPDAGVLLADVLEVPQIETKARPRADGPNRAAADRQAGQGAVDLKDGRPGGDGGAQEAKAADGGGAQP